MREKQYGLSSSELLYLNTMAVIIKLVYILFDSTEACIIMLTLPRLIACLFSLYMHGCFAHLIFRSILLTIKERI